MNSGNWKKGSHHVERLALLVTQIMLVALDLSAKIINAAKKLVSATYHAFAVHETHEILTSIANEPLKM